MINYIIQVLLFQALFLVVYDFFLQKETFFKWNRVYLITTPLLSFIIPLLKLQSVQKVVPQAYIVELPTVVLNPQVVIEQTVQNGSTFDYMQLLFLAGVLVFLMVFVWKLKSIIALIRNNKIVKEQDVNLVLVKEKQSAFSFFNYIFIHPSFLQKKNLKIIQHEIIHCKHYHTLDLLFFEILRIIMWFNPFIYVYQNRITVLHEYISDAEILKETNKQQYFNQLLSETFNIEKISFINQFYKHSLIKKRIVMITKNKSQKIKQLKYLLVVPLLFVMLVYVSCRNDAENELLQGKNELRKVSIYYGKENKVKQTNKLGYFDLYFTGAVPKNGKEITFDNLSDEEKKEFEGNSLFKRKDAEHRSYRFYEFIDGTRAIKEEIDWKSLKSSWKNSESIDEDGFVRFATIEETPVFPGCKGTKEELKKCFQEKIQEHIVKEFNASLANELNLESGVNRIIAMFEIDNYGNISNIKARAPHKALAEEAIRAIGTLPQFEPGKHSGKEVKVKYSLPIAFKVE